MKTHKDKLDKKQRMKLDSTYVPYVQDDFVLSFPLYCTAQCGTCAVRESCNNSCFQPVITITTSSISMADFDLCPPVDQKITRKSNNEK